MERLKGIPFSDNEKVELTKGIIEKKLVKGLRVFIHTLLADGFFHADLHGGNFFLLEDHRIGIIDFGLVGSLSKKSRLNLIAIMYSLITHNYENLVHEFLDVADYEKIPDMDDLINDVRDGLSPFVGLTVQQMDLSLLLKTVVGILTRHQIFLPREWFIVFRSLITLDGVGKSLGMDFDIFSISCGYDFYFRLISFFST